MNDKKFWMLLKLLKEQLDAQDVAGIESTRDALKQLLLDHFQSIDPTEKSLAKRLLELAMSAGKQIKATKVQTVLTNIIAGVAGENVEVVIPDGIGFAGSGPGRKATRGFGMAPAATAPRESAPRENAPPESAPPPAPTPTPATPPQPSTPTQRAKPTERGSVSPGAAQATDEPPRSAYALLDAPDSVVSGDEFDVVVGLSAVQQANVVGGQLGLPSNTVYPYTLSLQLIAEGFDTVDGAAWRQDVTATKEEPYPNTNFHLKAQSQEKGVQPRALQVIYSIAGQTIGFAVRPIAVLSTTSRAKVPPAEATVTAIDAAIPTHEVPPDLTINIVCDPNVKSKLLWTIESPHATVAQFSEDAKAETTDIGNEPDKYARQLVQDVNQEEGQPGLQSQMQGVAVQVADQIPASVWKAIQAAAAAAKGPPSIQINSQEPYIPWELAEYPAPLAVKDAPAFLGAQTSVGRWALGLKRTLWPAPRDLNVEAMAVIWGVYDSSKWARLTSAEAEADSLKTEYGAISVDAKIGPLLQCLKGDPSVTALHFAIHGIYNPGGLQNGLVLTDNATIKPTQVQGQPLAAHPFVFLNACQVGSAQQVLGDYAGMASAFLQAQATAVIAPLWSIKDGIAKEISLEFYKEAFAGETVAEVMRKQRAKYGKDNSATYLAYQYFGHPHLRLSRKKAG